MSSSGPTSPSHASSRSATGSPRRTRAATKRLRLLLERAGQLADFPDLGRVVPELPQGDLRELVEKPYRIVYRVREKTIEIATVFEGYREFPSGDVGEAQSR